MKYLLTLCLVFASQSILASGGGGGGSSYGTQDYTAQALEAAKKAKGFNPMELVNSMSKDQKVKLMNIFKDDKKIEMLKKFLLKK